MASSDPLFPDVPGDDPLTDIASSIRRRLVEKGYLVPQEMAREIVEDVIESYLTRAGLSPSDVKQLRS